MLQNKMVGILTKITYSNGIKNLQKLDNNLRFPWALKWSHFQSNARRRGALKFFKL